MRWTLIALIPLALCACGDIEDTEEYQQGYKDGHEEGYEEGKNDGRQEICDEIDYRLNSGAANAVGC